MERKRRTTNDDDAELWRANPSDVRRHARRMRERERAGPIGTIVRYALVAAVLVAIVVGYRNFDTIRAIAADLVARTGSSPGGSAADGGDSPAGDEPAAVVVEREQIAGTPLPSAVGGAPPTPDAAAAESSPAAAPPAAAPPADEPVVAAEEPVAAPPPVVAPPEPPPGPETFELGSTVVTVSEAAASAAVLVLRGGDRRRASTIVWSTREGTAKAGSDYIDRGAVVERFGAGEQNRTIRVPIVGDRNAEGVEDFYVILAPDSDAAGQRREAQVIVDDDD